MLEIANKIIVKPTKLVRVCAFFLIACMAASPLQAKSKRIKPNIYQDFGTKQLKSARNLRASLKNKENSHEQAGDNIASVEIPQCKIHKGKFSWNFKKAKIVDVIDQISRLTCKSFILSNTVCSSKEITILSRTPVTVGQAWSAFQAALAANEIALVKTGQFYKVIKRNQLAKSALRVVSDQKALPFDEEVVTYVHELQHTSKDAVRHLLKGLISRQGEIDTVGDGLLVITDGAANIRRITGILAKIDVAGTSNRIHLVDLAHGDARYMQQKLQEIFNSNKKGSSTSAAARAARIRAGTSSTLESFNIEKIIADDRTNKLIIITSDRAFLRVKEVIAMLDVSSSDASSQGKIHVYPLKNNDAKKISTTLAGLTQGLSNKKASQLGSRLSSAKFSSDTASLFEDEIKITADESTNSLVIVASLRDFRSLRKVIDKLDKPRTQVYVEAAILELSFSDNINTSINAFGALDNPFGKGGMAISTNPGGKGMIADMIKGIAAGGAALTSMLGTIGYMGKTTKIGGQDVSGVGIVLNALEGYSNVDVLATPSMMTLDNEKTEMSVGRRVPVVKGTSQIGVSGGSGGVGIPFQSVSYEDVKLEFTVTPHVNNIDQIRLEIDQKVNDVGETKVVAGSENPVINTKSAKTTIVANDQQTVVIGGLISHKIRKIESKVPILGDIPILGWLFKTYKEEKEKSNLLIVLTPYIIRTQADYQKIYLRKMHERKEFANMFFGNKVATYDPHVDYSVKVGPAQKLIGFVKSQMQKTENGGMGIDGEMIIKPNMQAKSVTHKSSAYGLGHGSSNDANKNQIQDIAPLEKLVPINVDVKLEPQGLELKVVESEIIMKQKE